MALMAMALCVVEWNPGEVGKDLSNGLGFVPSLGCLFRAGARGRLRQSHRPSFVHPMAVHSSAPFDRGWPGFCLEKLARAANHFKCFVYTGKEVLFTSHITLIFYCRAQPVLKTYVLG